MSFVLQRCDFFACVLEAMTDGRIDTRVKLPCGKVTTMSNMFVKKDSKVTKLLSRLQSCNLFQPISYFSLPQASPSLSPTSYAIDTIDGLASLNPDEDPLFGARIEWNNDYGTLAVGAPHHGETSQGAIFVYDASYQLLWYLVGDGTEGLGGRFSFSDNLIAVGRLAVIEIYDAQTGGMVGQPIESQRGNDVNLVNDNLLIIGEDRDSSRQGRIRILNYEDGDWIQLFSIPGFFAEGRCGWVVAASESGDRIAVSSPNASSDFNKQGYVLVMERTNGRWGQVGDVLYGAVERGQFGFSLAMSGDGTTIVVGSPGTNDGGVASFRLDTSEGTWQQVGSTIVAKDTGMHVGRSVAVSHDGQRIATTSFFFDTHRGHARVFDLVEGEWVPAHEVEGTNQLDRLGFGNFGLTLSPDGTILTVGAVLADTENGERTGQVQIADLERAAGTLANDAFFSAPSAMPSGEPSPIASPSEAPSSSPSKFPTEDKGQNPVIDGPDNDDDSPSIAAPGASLTSATMAGALSAMIFLIM